ncbi:MAG: nuclear transport factor 2 family protein [Chloroflexi bacterium]|nr:nuclear transport factor 2 family protein [Chloroflexota bacterium]
MIATRRNRDPWTSWTPPGHPILVLAVASVLALVAALTTTPALAAPSTPAVWAATPEDVVRAWVATINRGDTEAAIALYADDALIEAPGQRVLGKPAIARRQRTIVAPVVRPRVDVERLTVEGETVVVRLAGENALTRFDGRGPVHATTTFLVQNGVIQHEAGPVLDPADAAWYADAMPRFRVTGTLPTLLPGTGILDPVSRLVAVLSALAGASLLAAGLLLLAAGLLLLAAGLLLLVRRRAQPVPVRSTDVGPRSG